MREIRPSGSEGGVRLNPSSLPLSGFKVIQGSSRKKTCFFRKALIVKPETVRRAG